MQTLVLGDRLYFLHSHENRVEIEEIGPALKVEGRLRQLLGVIFILIAAIFLADVLTPPQLDASILYVLPQLLSAKRAEATLCLLVAALSVILTVAGFYLTSGEGGRFALVNRMFTIVVILCLTIICAKRHREILARRDERE